MTKSGGVPESAATAGPFRLARSLRGEQARGRGDEKFKRVLNKRLAKANRELGSQGACSMALLLNARRTKRWPQTIRISITSELAESRPSEAPTCRPSSLRGRAFSTLAAKRIRSGC